LPANHCECTGVLTGNKDFRRDTWPVYTCKTLEFLNELRIPILILDWEHSTRVTDADDFFTGELPMYISCKRCDKCYVLDVFLTVQYSLVQMRHAPPIGNVEVEQLRQFIRRFACGGILPRPERDEQIIVPVEHKIPVHHRGNTGS